MKTLKDSIKENVLSDIETSIRRGDIQVIHFEISNFINKYYRCTKGYTISNKPNINGKYEVDTIGNAVVKNRRLTSLTNDMFVWNNVAGWFDCRDCEKLTSLEGAPNEVGAYFSCVNCEKLTSLEGAPNVVGTRFECKNCKVKFTEDDVKAVCKVYGEIEC